MANTNDMIRKFFTTDAIDDGTTSAILNGEFSVAGDITTWTNTDDATHGVFILNATFSAAPTANTTIDLFAQLMNIDGTSDAPVPGTPASAMAKVRRANTARSRN